jgi:[histone H3]-lysine4 N-trimethyltransferase ASH1L
MPLRQATLDFGANSAKKGSTASPLISSEVPTLSRSSSASSETLPGNDDPDTIVVDGHEYQPQLPTPAESTMDTMSETSNRIRIDQVPQSKSRRVKQGLDRKLESRDCIVEDYTGAKGRSVSGETLVTSTSQSSLLRNGIAALDLPWSVTSLVEQRDKDMNEQEIQASENQTVDGEEDQIRAEKAAAKKAKMEENAKLWEARKRAADENAVRRSSRASMMGKAGDAVSDLTAGVLGKRPWGALEKGKDKLSELKRRASLRPRSMVEPLLPTAPAFEGPMAKQRRLSDSNLHGREEAKNTFTIPRKPLPARKDKRWLSSGLYTGQTRDFDGRLTESKNKRKRDAAPPMKENKTLPLPMFAGERIMKFGRDFKLPYDVFSPLPAGQPRPDEWRKTNKNVFVGDAAQVWRHSKPQEHSTCICTPETRCNEDCMNRFMFYECDDRNCNLSDCTNRSFHSLLQRSKKGGKYNVGVEVIQTRDRGFGVRSNRMFEPNQIIVEYTGEIITQDECDARMNTLYKNNEVRLEFAVY